MVSFTYKLPLYILFVWFDSLRSSQQTFSYLGTGLPGLKNKCVLLKDTTLWHWWGLRKLRLVPPSLNTNNICWSINGSELKVKAEHSRIQRGDRQTPCLDNPNFDRFLWKLAFGPPPPPAWKKLDPCPPSPHPENVGSPLEPWQIIIFLKKHRTPSGSAVTVVECLTPYIGAAGSSLTSVTVFWSLSKTHLSLLSTGSTPEDPSLYNWKIVDGT